MTTIAVPGGLAGFDISWADEACKHAGCRNLVSRSDAMHRDRILVDTLGPGSRNERRNLSGEPFPCHPGVVEVPLGDEVDGFLAEETVRSVSEIVPWLEEAIAHFFPASSYIQSLALKFRSGRNRLFHAPKTAASVICPHCGAPHAAPPGMESFSSSSAPPAANA